jgi:cytochrome b6-f complex iron-sulfur subunit
MKPHNQSETNNSLQENNKSCQCTSRRKFLEGTGNWISLAVTAAIVYPLARFINYQLPPRTRQVKIYKSIPINGFFTEKDFIVFNSDSGLRAISRKCTHLGCRINFKEKEQLLICPCHQSKFTTEGKRIAGPAKRNLPTYKVDEMKNSDGINNGFIVTI